MKKLFRGKSLFYISLLLFIAVGCSPDDEPFNGDNPTDDPSIEDEPNGEDDSNPLVIIGGESFLFNTPGEEINIDFKVKTADNQPVFSLEGSGYYLQINYERGKEAYNNGDYPVIVKQKLAQSKDAGGNDIEGQYSVTLADRGANVFNYSEEVSLSLEYKGPDNKSITLNSKKFNIGFNSENNIIMNTGLPVVVIDIPQGKEITSKNDWTENVVMSIYKADGTFYDSDSENISLQMKGRGNSTWNMFPKKPYALKLDKKAKILGMKKHKRWCLLANYIDRTLMRNAVAFEISKQTDLAWTPSGEFVELVINGTPLGNYYLTAHIQVDENRVNITDVDYEDLKEGTVNERGFIFELDTNFDEINKFTSSIFKMPFMFKDPDEVWTSEFNDIKNYVSSMEQSIRLSLNKNYQGKRYTEYLDISSFADWWIVNELMMNTEAYHPKSSYMYKDVDSKMFAGPVWDFDWGTLTNTRPSDFSIKGAIYYGYLFQDEEFVDQVKANWRSEREKLEKIPDFIEGLREKLRHSNKLNYDMWGTEQDPNYESPDYDEAVNRIIEAYIAKFNWLDNQINNL